MRSTQAAVTELRDGVVEPMQLRRRVAALMRELAEAPIGLWYSFGLVDGEPLPVDWSVVGAGDVLLERWLEERHAWPGGDPRLPDRTSGRFVTMGAVFEGDALTKTSLYQRCVAPMNIGDQVRMMVYHRHRHVGWIGALRGRHERPFGSRELRRLRAATPAITSALIHAHITEAASSLPSCCDLVLTADGGVELASETAAPIVAHPERGPMLAEWTRRAERGGEPPRVLAGHRVHWSRLSGARGARSYYLLHLERIEPLRVLPTFQLSKTQRRVADYAGAGAQVEEIAAAMGVAPTTVRTHLRAIYAKLGVSTRAELVRAIDPAG